jgi:hypothetical protein
MNTSIKKTQPIIMLFTIAFVVISFKTQNDILRTNESTTITESKNSFTIKSVSNVAVPIESIDKIHKFDPNEKFGGFRCVTTGSLGATDYGPYKELYFIFDNAFEMPHRTAIFKIGNLANIRANAFNFFKHKIVSNFLKKNELTHCCVVFNLYICLIIK